MSISGLNQKRNCIVGGEATSVVLPNTDIDNLLSQFEDGIATSLADTDPITRLIQDFGRDSFYGSVAAINFYFSRSDVRSLINSNEYPLLQDRINSNVPFTPIEIANFIIEYGYSPSSLIFSSSIVSTRLIFEFESFYTRNFTSSTMGSFCALLPNIFGAINVFFDALDDVANLVNKLKNFSLSFSLTSLLDNLKTNITMVIDKVVQKVKNIIENFSIENVISEIGTFINQQIVSRFYQLKESILGFFDPTNIENFKKKIGALIDYATGVFKNPTLEDIQYLLYRFCGFISLVENSINALKNPIDNFVNSYKQTVNILRSNSVRNSARASTAGAIRYTLPVQNEGINNTQKRFEIVGNAPPLTGDDVKNITQWNDGNGDSRVIFTGNWIRPPAPSGRSQDGGVGRDGWEQVNINVRANLMRIQKDFGKQLNIVSGFRPQVYNDSLTGAVKNSLHVSKTALDVSWNGFNVNSEDANKFITLAEYYGFTHIGKYGPRSGNFIHIGVGRTGRWEKA